MEEKNFDKNLGVNARRLREAAGFSQETLASYLGLSRSTYKQYENSKRRFPAYLVLMLTEFYGVRHPMDFFEDDILKSSKYLAEKMEIIRKLDIDEFEKTVVKFSEDQILNEEKKTNYNIKHNIKKYRISNNKNQQQVADRLGVNLSTYSRYESGDVIIDNNKLGILSNWYNVPITDFYKDID
ncbi:MAG: helix-turn-helix domain-containing protein [Bacilli bacterium]